MAVGRSLVRTTSSSWCGTPSGSQNNVRTAEYTAVDTPMPSASERTANTVNPGAMRSRRSAMRTSRRIGSIYKSLSATLGSTRDARDAGT